MQEDEEDFSATPVYHFHPLYRHFEIIWTIFVESSPSHIQGVPKKKETFLKFDINLFSAKTYKHVVSKESLENCATGHISFDNMV